MTRLNLAHGRRAQVLASGGWIRALDLAIVLSAAALAASCPLAHAQELSGAVYGSKLITVETEGDSYRRGPDLFGLRVVGEASYGQFSVAARGDITALGAIDPANLDLTSARTLEGYAAASWQGCLITCWVPHRIGPAVMAGTVVPVEAAATYTARNVYGAGLRLDVPLLAGYALVGLHGAADAAAGGGSRVRLMLTGKVELRRVAVIGDFVSGRGGWGRVGIAYRIPLP